MSRRKRLEFHGTFLLPEGFEGDWMEAFALLQAHSMDNSEPHYKGVPWPDEARLPLRIQGRVTTVEPDTWSVA